MEISQLNCTTAVNSSAINNNGTDASWLGRSAVLSSAGEGHQEILNSHANSGLNALIYVGIVLLVYVLAVCFIGFRYFLTRSQRKLLFTPYYFYKTKVRFLLLIFDFLYRLSIYTNFIYLHVKLPYNVFCFKRTNTQRGFLDCCCLCVSFVLFFICGMEK